MKIYNYEVRLPISEFCRSLEPLKGFKEFKRLKLRLVLESEESEKTVIRLKALRENKLAKEPIHLKEKSCGLGTMEGKK